jgi:TldD protein
MKSFIKSSLKIGMILMLGIFLLSQTMKGIESPSNPVVLKAMEEELSRSMKVLGEKGSPPPYFIGYQITDTQVVSISAAFGALGNIDEDRSRLLYVEVRVGNHQLDSTHPIRGDRYSSFFDYFSTPVPISLEDDVDSIKSAIWLETHQKYKNAVEKLIKVNTSQGVSVKEEDQSDDFSKETPQKYIGELHSISPDVKAWESKLKDFSALFNRQPEIFTSRVSLNAQAENKYFVNSEGTSLLHGSTHWRLSFYATTKADDGMELTKYKYFDARTLENLPGDEKIKAAIEEVMKALMALRSAPVMEPFTGPAILSGEAAAVFFHEIFGHRIEGHRQKDEEEGQTFTKKINQEVLPTFLTVYDDPNLQQYDNTDLNGYYLYDDEGIKAQRANLVEKGILKGFLMSRSPIKGFSNSNGHGRCQAGLRPVSRQGVLVVEASQTLPEKELRQMLIKECKTQGKEYGLLFADVTGGFTSTTRYRPEAFNVTPIMVYKIYVDGRPDELVRGVNLIGTPLTSFSKIIAAGQEAGIFNGYCGAESGSVPASGISPALLTAQIEVQKKYKDTDKPPVLPPPDRREK